MRFFFSAALTWRSSEASSGRRSRVRAKWRVASSPSSPLPCLSLTARKRRGIFVRFFQRINIYFYYSQFYQQQWLRGSARTPARNPIRFLFRERTWAPLGSQPEERRRPHNASCWFVNVFCACHVRACGACVGRVCGRSVAFPVQNSRDTRLSG